MKGILCHCFGQSYGNKKDLPLVAVASCQTSFAVVFNLRNCIQNYAWEGKCQIKDFSEQFKFGIHICSSHVSLLPQLFKPLKF